MRNDFVSARVDPHLKIEVQNILDELGITQSQAISMFYKAIQREHGIPFPLVLPNEETKTAIEETRKGKGLTSHKNTEDLFKDLGI
jgi:DNA-damage-inducible protein J